MHRPLPSYAQAKSSPDWAPTPDGLGYTGCNYHVPDGGVVDANGDIVVDGVVTTVPACPYDGVIPYPTTTDPTTTDPTTTDPTTTDPTTTDPTTTDPTTTDPTTTHPTTTDPAVPSLPQKWWIYSWWTKPSGYISKETANWKVPSRPSSYSGSSVVFLFPSLENTTSADIIQPVLQFGSSAAGNSTSWQIASWYVLAGNSYYSTLVSAPAGDSLTGKMKSASCSSTGANCTWTINTIDNTNGHSSGITVKTPQIWNQAQGGVLETYNLGNCAYLPASGSATFSDIKTFNANGNQVTPSFGFHRAVTSCSTGGNTTATITTLKWVP